METRKTKKAEISFSGACLWKVTGRWRVLGERTEGIHTLGSRSAPLPPEAGRAGERKEQTFQLSWPGGIAQCLRVINIRRPTSRSRWHWDIKIGVPDNTGIYHISVFRHIAVWPSHSKQWLVSCNMLRISDDDMHLSVTWNMSVLSVSLLTQRHNQQLLSSRHLAGLIHIRDLI